MFPVSHNAHRPAVIFFMILTIIYIRPAVGIGSKNSTTVKSPKNKFISLDEKYKSGVKAYTNKQWSECITQFEETIHLNKLYQSVITNCRFKCNELSYEPIVKNTMDDLSVYELYLRKAKCLVDCQTTGLHNLHLNLDVSEEVAANLAALEPYNFIHMCYFRMNLLPNAASAAYTYLMAHPKDTDMKHNYEYYKRQPEVDQDEVVDLESDAYKIQYIKGVNAYKKNQWSEMISQMEEALTNFILTKTKCKVECEQLFTPAYSAYTISFINDFVGRFVIILQCQKACDRSVGVTNFDSGLSFIADVLNHLQIGYYRLDRMLPAARAVQSYLLISPNDKDMMQNKDIYSSMVDQESFVEQPDVAAYVERNQYEKKILDYIIENFGNIAFTFI